MVDFARFVDLVGTDVPRYKIARTQFPQELSLHSFLFHENRQDKNAFVAVKVSGSSGGDGESH